jgi:hypothetical protein
MTKSFSPAAQAVLDAYNDAYESDRHAVAAALRAAADQAVPERCFESDDITAIRQQLLDIADELKAH